MASDETKLNPSTLALADVAKLLTKVGGQAVTMAMLEADLRAGAPANTDGTINLVYWADRQVLISV